MRLLLVLQRHLLSVKQGPLPLLCPWNQPDARQCPRQVHATARHEVCRQERNTAALALMAVNKNCTALPQGFIYELADLIGAAVGEGLELCLAICDRTLWLLAGPGCPWRPSWTRPGCPWQPWAAQGMLSSCAHPWKVKRDVLSVRVSQWHAHRHEAR